MQTKPADCATTIHVLLRKEDIDPERMAGRIVIVLDILFATTTILAAFDAGARQVVLANDEQHALALQRSLGESDSVLAGESMARTLPGFVAATPAAVIARQMAGRTLVYATTNGTVALLAAQGADAVHAAAMGNLREVARHVARAHAGRTVLVVCAGSAGRFNLEDFYGAGAMVAALVDEMPEVRLTDAARGAQMLYAATRHQPPGPGHPMWVARVGARMQGLGLDDDMHRAWREDTSVVVPTLQGGVLRPSGRC